jgi:hypothetical protein
MANHMLDAEPLEVAAVQGGKRHLVKQEAVGLSHFPSHNPEQRPARRSESPRTTPWPLSRIKRATRGIVSQMYLRQTPCPATTSQERPIPSRDRQGAVPGSLPRLLLIRQHIQIRHDVLHLRGTEFIRGHHAASRKGFWIAKMLFDPHLTAAALQTV